MTGAVVEVVNRQAEAVPVTWVRAVARRAAQRLAIRSGAFSIVLMDAAAMRRVNRRFLGHRGLTDVITFRYDDDGPAARTPIVGEILVSPTFAKRYAQAHGVPFREELARYVVHGFLHWIGHNDRTPAQQRRMRRLEDELLARCGVGASR